MLMTQRTTPLDPTEAFQFRQYECDGFTLPYRLYVPKNYDCGEKYPLLLFLHGAGERGNNNTKNLVYTDKFFADLDSPVYDSIVIVPQCPEEHQWVNTPWSEGNYSISEVAESRPLEAVCAILDEVCDFYNIDTDRIYVTGLSMGGFGTWDMLARHGARFAAGMPICGGGCPEYAHLLKRIPIRTFHGSDDTVVPPSGTREMYAAIRREGGENITYIELDGVGHGAWNPVYEDSENMKWLFSQSLAERRKKAERRQKITKAAAAGGIIGTFLSAVVIALVKSKKKKK